MSAESTLPALLATLTASLDSAASSVPSTETALPPANGISLFDTKNELLLSYLQHLVFLIIIKLRNRARSSVNSASDVPNGAPKTEEEVDFHAAAVKKLVELRIYLEKGVRPLETRLKYQVDKVIRAAEESALRASSQPTHLNRKPPKPENGIDDSSSSSSNSPPPQSATEISDLSYRPNPSSFLRPSQTGSTLPSSRNNSAVYRPPRITPTSLPTTTTPTSISRTSSKPQKSATLDEFISTELSTAPLAEPSIGSTITSGGRHSKSQKERDLDAEKRVYEETNFVRLPKESKKERAKMGRGGGRIGGYGGEEWRGLGEGVERIERLTRKKGGGGGGLLDRQKKRGREGGGGERGGGVMAIGERFEKRRKMMERRGRK
ncbi:MAG: hypothetical protein M1835_002712 [Candelina submexicana]|nr:MAG: hypothetical protein M1835_002712 [Candelina submexicana]